MSDGAPLATSPIRVLFIANRGEIAARIATTAHRLRIVPVVPMVRLAAGEVATRPGGGMSEIGRPAADPVDLLDPADVVRAALRAGADAVHPGYGFLAESPALAEAVVAAGMAWIGPPPDAIRTLGDKARAREAARRVDVPVAAGEEPDDQSDAALGASADRIGLPLLVKPAAGGGGKGIRVVRRRDELQPAFEAARREAARAFGDDRLIIERYLAPVRHVEVQVLADAHGSVLHLGDRDCSLQRRHQKVLEEAPAPDLAPELRAAIRAAAVRIAGAVGYVGAGTCEFLVADDGGWVFLEMNARLQVEHPVTELVLGRDLVADQLRIAEGAALAQLGLEQGEVEAALAAGGHAVEVRLNAEDPSTGFLPSAGPVVGVRWPDGAGAFGPAGDGGIRVDAGIAAGDLVGGTFDPLLAKIIAHGGDRAEALDRLAGALDATEVLGLVTNLAFLRLLVRLDVVREGRARTETLEEQIGEVAGATEIPGDAWRVAAEALGDATEAFGDATDALARAAGGLPAGAAGELAGQANRGPWGGGWRLNAPARLRLAATGPGGPEERSVELTSTVSTEASRDELAAAGRSPSPFAVRNGQVVHVSVGGRSVPFRLASPPELARASSRHALAGAETAADLVAPMPGTVLGVHVAVGDSVKLGDRIATLEAMKMEHVVSAPSSGPGRRALREGRRPRRPRPARRATRGAAVIVPAGTSIASRRVRIYEVGPRDGLQNEATIIPTAAKTRFISLLVAAGLREIEATSFVRPDRIPQLADADQLLPSLPRETGARFPVLVANARGLARAADAGAEAIAVFTAATDAFAEHNIGQPVEASLHTFAPLLADAARRGWWRRAYVSAAFGCPYTGAVEPARPVAVARRLFDLGADEVCFGDTIGVAVPSAVEAVTSAAIDAGIPVERIAHHFHDTRGTALANVAAALRLGVTCFDASTGGTGGCPYAPGASGNLATEDLVYLLDAEGIEHGVDLPRLLVAARFIAGELGRPVSSKVGQAGGWDATTGQPTGRPLGD